MQEEVENRAVNLAISTSKLTARAFIYGIRSYMHYRKGKTVTDPYKHGKQSVKQLIGQGQGVESMVIGDESIRRFCRIARKYGVDYAIKKDVSMDPPHYVAFFKAKDADALQHVIDDYTNELMKSRERESVLKKLKKHKEHVAELTKKERIRDKEIVR